MRDNPCDFRAENIGLRMYSAWTQETNLISVDTSYFA